MPSLCACEGRKKCEINFRRPKNSALDTWICRLAFISELFCWKKKKKEKKTFCSIEVAESESLTQAVPVPLNLYPNFYPFCFVHYYERFINTVELDSIKTSLWSACSETEVSFVFFLFSSCDSLGETRTPLVPVASFFAESSCAFLHGRPHDHNTKGYFRSIILPFVY